MGLETTTTISGLQSSNPAVGDLVATADDHIRLLKAVLKNVFPGSAGQGFATPITATEAELNYVKGVTSSIQTQLNNLKAVIPSGTRLLFSQAAAPVGWTQDVSDTADNRMLRVVKTAGGGTGGSHSPILMNVVPAHTHPFTTGGVSADHTHGFVDSTPTFNASARVDGASSGYLDAPTNVNKNTAGMSADHTHSGDTNNNTGASNWTPRYNNIIICQKN
jgi:hypothetical protein